MAKFLHHTSCEICGSKDNKAVYDDESTFCFGCRTATKATTNVHKVFQSTLPDHMPLNKEWPWDATLEIPSKPLQWLLQYGITQHTANTFGIHWSPSRQLLCWQIKSPSGKTLGWSTRNFSDSAKVKASHYGAIHDDINIVGYQRSITFGDDGDTTIILVEDYISAIKVSHHLPVMCLYGCTITLEALQALSKRFKGVILWLDSDKLTTARKIASRASLTGLTGQVLYTEHDPKEYTQKEIQDFLTLLQ